MVHGETAMLGDGKVSARVGLLWNKFDTEEEAIAYLMGRGCEVINGTVLAGAGTSDVEPDEIEVEP